jgi:hypothetical protein
MPVATEDHAACRSPIGENPERMQARLDSSSISTIVHGDTPVYVAGCTRGFDGLAGLARTTITIGRSRALLREEKVRNERNSWHLAATAARPVTSSPSRRMPVEELTFAGVGGDGNLLGSTRPVRWRLTTKVFARRASRSGNRRVAGGRSFRQRHGADLQRDPRLGGRAAWRYIQPGKPVQNAFAERFNVRLRDELRTRRCSARSARDGGYRSLETRLQPPSSPLEARLADAGRLRGTLAAERRA